MINEIKITLNGTPINLRYLKEDNETPMVKSIILILPNGKELLFYLDERFNEFYPKFDNLINEDIIHNKYIKSIYKEFKKTDFRYGIDNEIQGSKNTYLNDFINYLISRERDLKIKKILNE